MKKYIKYLFALVAAFFFLGNTVMATTIIETTKDDNYDTINEGSMIIGVTKFDSNVVLTASRVAKAGANDAALYAKQNNNMDDYNAPTIYVYYGVGGWYELDDDNNASMINDDELLELLSNQEIYYVNNVEKKIDVDLNGIEVDEEKITSGVSIKDGKLQVNATLSEFTVYTTNGKEITYVYADDVGSYVINNSVCYVTSNGYITDYNDKCISDVVLPAKVNGENIIGVKENAFNNKSITSVEVSENIMHLEDNAFANNNLNSVTIKDKYDKTDFTTYGNNVFDDFAEENIIYDNDLTRLLNKFNDENKVKVKTGLTLEKWDIASVIMHNETKRLNIKENELPEYAGDGMPTYVYDSKLYNIDLCFNSYCTNESLNDNEMILNITSVENNRGISKKITYEVEEVDVESNVDENVNNASKEIEEYLASATKSFVSGNYNTALFDQKEVEKIIFNNNLYGLYIGGGDGDASTPLEVTDKISIKNEGGHSFILISDDVVVENSFDVKYYSCINYDATNIEGEYANIDEKIDAAIEAFEKETNIKNYLINMNGDHKYYSYVTKDKDGNNMFIYTVSIIDEDTNNFWLITIDEKEEDPIIVNTSNIKDENGNMIQNTLYSFYPNISFDDYNTTEEFKNAAIEKLTQKVGVSDFSDYYVSMNLQPGTLCEQVDGKYECKYEPNEDGIYEYHYVVSLYPKKGSVDGKLTTYTIHLYKYLNYEIKNNDTGMYEVEINVNDYVGQAADYKNEVIKLFVEENNITDYEVSYSDGYYLKNTETNEVEKYEGSVNSDMTNVYDSLRIIDHSKNKLWIVLYPYSSVIYDQISN